MVRNIIPRLRHAGLRNLFQIVGLMVAIILPVMLIYLYDPAFFNSITQNITLHPIAFRLFRWGMILSFMLVWPYVTRKFGENQGVSQEQIISWHAQTFRVGMWMIIFELLVCENILAKIIHWW